MSRQLNSEQSVVLFGDRVDAAALEDALTGRLPFGAGPGRDWLVDTCAPLGITIALRDRRVRWPCCGAAHMGGMSNDRLFAQAYRRQAWRTVPTADPTSARTTILIPPARVAEDQQLLRAA